MTKVADLMTRVVESIGPASTIQEAAERMKAENLGSLPVCLDSRVVGALTDRDITVRVTAEGRDPQATFVRDVMSPRVVTVGPQQDLAEAAQLMYDHQVRRLPVVEADGRLVGYVTMSGIAKREGDEKAVGKMLKGISTPGTPPPERIGPIRSRGRSGI